jgi:hypothetical protein
MIVVCGCLLLLDVCGVWMSGKMKEGGRHLLNSYPFPITNPADGTVRVISPSPRTAGSSISFSDVRTSRLFP